ncbi:hypothetical protein HDV05_002339 [Chytridiales sp. JEL 0842]|nr:hypothetical protein HDV05_002339 [Chytridiales sp. JEL 0842]
MLVKQLFTLLLAAATTSVASARTARVRCLYTSSVSTQADPRAQVEAQFEKAAASIEGLEEVLPQPGKVLDPEVYPIKIPVYFHVIAKESGGEGDINNATLQAQLDVLNQGFQGRFEFDLKQVIRYAEPQVYGIPGDPANSPLAGGPLLESVKEQTRVGGSNALNLYITGEMTAQEGADQPTFGYAQFPYQYQAKPKTDGVIITGATLPGGKKPFHLGLTALHEIGHWLGLYHTFFEGEDSAKACVSAGDYVSDTYVQNTTAVGECPVVNDSCPDHPDMLDNIHNFMDYSSDICLTHFTPGQYVRMVKQWFVFRAVAEE